MLSRRNEIRRLVKIYGVLLTVGIVYRCIATPLCSEAGFSRKTAQAGAKTLISRFGGALSLNVQLKGAYPCAPPLVRSAGVEISNPADLLHAVPRRRVRRAGPRRSLRTYLGRGSTKNDDVPEFTEQAF